MDCPEYPNDVDCAGCVYQLECSDFDNCDG
jgi:hypothetical protein